MADKKLLIKLAADVEQLKGGLKQAKSSVDGFKSHIMGMAASIGAAFAVERIADFAFEVTKLAGEAKGVKAAFDRLQDSERLMQRMKDATHNTVSELELMKRSVQASNFKISLEALPKLLEFATLRAQQTGQSVDYLVDSIVTGIGRKSALILDNLGISAAELNEQLKQTPDYASAVAAIIDREMPKMGEFVENAATQTEKLNASWQNFKVQIGEIIEGPMAKLLGRLAEMLSVINQTQGAFKKLAVVMSLAVNPAGTVLAIKNQSEYNEKLAETKKLLENTVPLGPHLQQLWVPPPKAKEEIKAVAEEIKKAVKPLKGFTGDVGAKLSGADAITSFLDPKRLDGPLDHIKTKLTEMKAPVIDFQQNLQKLGLIAVDVGQMMAEGMNAGFTALGEALGAAFAGVGDFGRNFLLALTGFAKQVGQILIGLGTAALAAKKLLITNPVAAIAAGVALVAIASAAQHAIGKAQQNFASAGSGGGSVSSTRAIDSGVFNQRPLQVEITGGWRLEGSTLVAAIDKANYRKGIIN